MDGRYVGSWHSIRKAMEVDRIITRALRGGTTAMRALGTVLTPMDHRERRQWKEYQARLLRTCLFGAYNDAIGGIVDKPFQRAIEVKAEDQLPENLQMLSGDCDREGTNLTQMGRMLMDSLADTGIAMLLVDKPPALVVEESTLGLPPEQQRLRPMTLAEEEANEVRPYFVFLHPDSVINWSWRRESNGKRVLSGIAIYEEEQSSGTFQDAETTVQRVRIWREDMWQLWEREAPLSSYAGGLTSEITAQADLLITSKQAANQTQGSEREPYVLVAQGPNPLGRVPVVFRNVAKRGSDPLSARPPLIDLAWKNVDDWLVTSSLSNNIHWHSYPVLSIAGASADLADGTQEIVYGAGATIISRDPNMRVGFVETAGAAAQQLMARLASIRQEEQSLGLAPFLDQVSAGTTATAVDAAGARSQSRVQSWTEQLEWLLYDAYQLAMLWETAGRTDELPEEFDLDIFRDFGIPTRSQTDLQTLLQMRQMREITQPTFLREVQKRGTLGDEVDVSVEVEETSAEGASLSELMPQVGLPVGEDEPASQEEPEEENGTNDTNGDNGDNSQAPAAVAAAAGVPAADTALNGAQVQAAAAIVQQVAMRQLPRDSGVAQLVEFFNLPADKAERIMGDVGRGFFIGTEVNTDEIQNDLDELADVLDSLPDSQQAQQLVQRALRKVVPDA